MSKEKGRLFVGKTPLSLHNKNVGGKYIEIEGEKFYCIENYDQMPPFFMSIVGHLDSWMFISSTGGLSAGRKDENNALFPYYTDDKIASSFETTGSKTLVLVDSEDQTLLWEPFSDRYEGAYEIHRNIYKNVNGNTVIFEEINLDLNLTFRYSWSFSETFGFVRRCTFQNFGNADLSIRILDGVQNVLPYGINSALQRERSNLVNAYKRNELVEGGSLALYTLSAMIIDRAIPSESLKATTIWSIGLESKHYLLSSKQVASFRKAEPIQQELDVKAEPGAYFMESEMVLKSDTTKSWYVIAQLSQDQKAIVDIEVALKGDHAQLMQQIEADLSISSDKLRKLVGLADGIQMTGDGLSTSRHFSNVMFNIMRGGLFVEQYAINTHDLKDFVNNSNHSIFKSEVQFFDSLSDSISYAELLKKVKNYGNHDLMRLCYEYLPLSFSRRHGDPSRPWNKFSIETNREDGTPNFTYQGNWRDIFQNWEALTVSFPGFIESVIVKFFNASTADGYNPYRISRGGIDWEVIEPEDPWSYIGYWGDHQIIYLLKLLELSYEHDPSKIIELLDQKIFVHANVPYRIKKYDEIYQNPYDTIDFDLDKEHTISDRVTQVGSDGKLVSNSANELLKTSFTEKLLITFLTKLYNFVPDAGIWLNTQRPEWNDANNALVGNGVSMVTLYHLRRFVTFCKKIFIASNVETHSLNQPLYELFTGVLNTLEARENDLVGGFTDESRKRFVDQMGRLGEAYRESVYENQTVGFEETSNEDILDLLNKSLLYFDESIKNNRREDKLYHSYNLIDLNEDSISISHLYEMLEGQVAVLSSGKLKAQESLEVLDCLKSSKIYREDQYSYMLYPNRELPLFLKKNNLSKNQVDQSELITELLNKKNHSIVVPDALGGYHFNGSFNNADDLKMALIELQSDAAFVELAEKDAEYLLQLFETTFNHKAFTGRSGTFFGYEGLGSIYWHMVSKLLLTVQENLQKAKRDKVDEKVIGSLIDHYYEIRAGIGINKSPKVYGGFPTDPYSHTPFGKGVQQPGMTGQVKEDILSRWAELGIHVKDAKISFNPFFMSQNEFLDRSIDFEYYDVASNKQSILLEKDSLAFTYCQVPVVYQMTSEKSAMVHLEDGSELTLEAKELNKELSLEIFNRTGKVKKIVVSV